ncbi:M36 family metallopeptidase [Dokdonia sp. Hel_I_53]|uniref:M36 family metallopeptidase n=1 Tax=Dokdonia sp. Hel_I_53 TaxID=1566287 RepID=UPI001199C608|nr:M36 family metallopeptidase [Dokdonia sp. Hel_I_53]TVZ52568.1 putative secreted protein (Por secretion system target) [Dokdonia sp. Hel_I_53]
MKKFYTLFLMAFLLGTTAYAQKSMDGIVQNYLTGNAGEDGLKSTDVSQFKVTNVVPSLNPNIKHVYVQQMYQGIPIQNGTYKLTVKGDKVTFEINQFVKNLTEKAAGKTASLSPENAIQKVVSDRKIQSPRSLNSKRVSSNVFEYANSGMTLEPIRVEQTYLAIGDKMHLTWNVSIYPTDGQHWWNVNVDASTGEILKVTDWVISCSFEDPNHLEHGHSKTRKNNEIVLGPVRASEATAVVGGGSYNVYPLGIESPIHGNRIVVTDPANATASPYGWHDTNGAAGAEFTTTRGNNVLAQDDTNGNNGTGVSPNGGSSLNFNFPYDQNASPSTYLPAATTNLFYWNNLMHDVWYQYGFDEASGNFQENNYGKGGAGSDSVNADAQDGSGTNNANFATPPDGQNPRMQMFLFTNPTRDGDFDNGIIAHEYGHGISSRLVGGPSFNGLGGSEQMGEGWSDWMGLVMTIRPGDTRNTARGIGNFAIGQSVTGAGIRPTRYSPDFAVNGTTYDNIGSLAVPHGVGYGFATILWDMTWDLIDLEGLSTDQYNGTGGNNIAMALVIEGLKNTANNPGYVSGRDGILQADQDLYGGQYNCLIWDAFARRGVGVDAVENSNGGTNTNTDQITSYTSGCAGPPQPVTCNSTVANFPYNEGFENTIGAWSQDTTDNINWTVNTGGTPSNGTGPAAANEGTYYIYVEASGDGAGFPNKTAILYSPCFDLSGVNGAEASFSYQMTGTAVGTIRLEARDDASQTWTELWVQSGDKGAAWIDETVSLSAYSGSTQLRFRATTAASWSGDIAIDGFSVGGAAQADTQAPTTPTSLSVTSVTDTTINIAWNASTDNVAVTGYDVYQGATLLGNVAATTAEITGLTEDTSYNFTVRARDAAGNVSNASNTATGTTTGGVTNPSGCAGGVNSFPYTESFEANIGLWSQGNGDDLDWTRDSSGTPSSGTGPTTGAQGSFYMFVEASGDGVGYPNKSATLNSPCFDLSSETDAIFTFNYHANGAGTMGSIALEASTDGGANWSSLWSQTAYQGTAWQTQAVSLSAFAGNAVQLRFVRVTGNTWQADVAVDNTRVTVSGGTDPNPPTGYCASNGNSVVDEYIQRVQIGSINNATTASSGGYGNYTNLSTNLSASNSITITPAWTGTVYSEGYAVFVDWNRDGDFTDAGETVYTRAATTATPITGSFNTPAGAQAGPTRMRVSMKYNGIPTACESFQYGEVEDYIVVIGASATGFAAGSDSFVDNGATALTSMNLYPNPVSSTLNVDLNGATADKVVVYNLLGQRVVDQKFTPSLDVARLESGIYIIEVTSGDTVLNKRFIKK